MSLVHYSSSLRLGSGCVTLRRQIPGAPCSVVSAPPGSVNALPFSKLRIVTASPVPARERPFVPDHPSLVYYPELPAPLNIIPEMNPLYLNP